MRSRPAVARLSSVLRRLLLPLLFFPLIDFPILESNDSVLASVPLSHSVTVVTRLTWLHHCPQGNYTRRERGGEGDIPDALAVFAPSHIPDIAAMEDVPRKIIPPASRGIRHDSSHVHAGREAENLQMDGMDDPAYPVLAEGSRSLWQTPRWYLVYSA